MKHALRGWAAVGLVALALVTTAITAGCSIGGLGALGFDERSSVRMLSAAPMPARPASYPISITANDYQDPYDEVAVIQTKPYRDDKIETSGEAALRDLAREVGADAVVHVARRSETGEEIAYRPGMLFRTGTRFVERSALTGVAVRFRREAAK